MFQLNSKGIPDYAQVKTGKEIYPKNDGLPYFLEFKNQQFYAKDENKNEYYFPGDDEKVFAINKTLGVQYFAKNSNDEEYYPKNFNHDEFTFNQYILNGYIVYPIDKYNRSIYPEDYNTQYYLYDTRKKAFIFGSYEKNEFYAKDLNLNDIYPPTFNIAIKSNTEQIYAIDKDNFVIYPKNFETGEEIYLENNEGSFEIISKYRVKRYAAYNEYPLLKQNYYGVEVTLSNEYLKIDGKSFYPTDDYGNEYIPNNMNMILTIGYNITFYSYIIVPNNGAGIPLYLVCL
ncbi:hypothetical protein AVEN_266002-1 [Araneus ventricosus]|uniref:Uncharacterized protein n=1 Tax=Araneus ventricosus TaxID=182803 RepID=A0A4Y2W5Y7_ARAVE|nr:hypothetical protein AVEN_266002-1 [Araneus ventricosus]